MKVLTVAGARPNFMKIAPLIKALRMFPTIEQRLVHTGQHYDVTMSTQFFEEFELPRPDVYLEVGSASHAVQTAKIMMAFETVLIQERPDVVVVVGDVNSTIGCALPAVKLHIPVAHVEAGLRSFDRRMPEEINRILTDAISETLFVSEPSGRTNLLREGIPDEKIFMVGNVMIDTLLAHKEKAASSEILRQIDVTPHEYALLTLHRPSNVDDPEVFANLLNALERIQQRLPIIFPAHPRTRKRLEEFGLFAHLKRCSHIRLIEPLGYFDFLKLMTDAKIVLTDSGGIQEETTILNVPCVTLRDNTERPITVEQGTNELAGTDPQQIVATCMKMVDDHGKQGRIPDLWDGQAAGRIATILNDRYCT